MFKSEGVFTGLDRYFHTNAQSHALNTEHMKERITEIDVLYKEWSFHLWNFSSDNMEKNEILSDCHDVIELMRDAANCYVLAMFVPSIQASSSAVERLLNVVLYLEKRTELGIMRDKGRKPIESPQSEWILVNTVSGDQYYTRGFRSRIFRRKDGFVEFRAEELHDAIQHIPDPPYCKEKLCPAGDLDNCVLVDRRNAASHGVTTRLLLIEQVHGYRIDKPEDWWTLINNRHSALEQYRSAVSFVIDTFGVFTQKYGHSD